MFPFRLASACRWLALAALIFPSLALAEPFAYVPNAIDGTVSVIDTASNTVVDSISTGFGPQGVSASPDGSRLDVPLALQDEVAVIDTGTNSVVTNVPVGRVPMGRPCTRMAGSCMSAICSRRPSP